MHIIDMHMHLQGSEQFIGAAAAGGLLLPKLLKRKLVNALSGSGISKPLIYLHHTVSDNCHKYKEHAIRGIHREYRRGRRIDSVIMVHGVSQILDLAASPLNCEVKGAGWVLTQGVPKEQVSARNRIMDFMRSGRTFDRHQEYYINRNMQKWGWFKDTLSDCVIAHEELYKEYTRGRPNFVPWYFAPFDPRRGDCISRLEEDLNRRGCLGVKLYTRCGWSPDAYGRGNSRFYAPSAARKINRHLNRLYELAKVHKIPLLVHTSPGGWPPDHEICFPERFAENLLKRGAERDHVRAVRAYDQSTVNPINWIPVLERFPSLQLCIGHLGGQAWGGVGFEAKENPIWIAVIRDLMVRYDNVYGDVSFWISDKTDAPGAVKRLNKMIDGRTRANRRVNQKVMFGTDWPGTTSEKHRVPKRVNQVWEAWHGALLKGATTREGQWLPSCDDFFRGNARRFISGDPAL